MYFCMGQCVLNACFLCTINFSCNGKGHTRRMSQIVISVMFSIRETMFIVVKLNYCNLSSLALDGQCLL